MNDKTMKSIIIVARLLSAIFRPSYYPLVGLAILFTLTYLSLLPWVYKLWILGMVYLFTIALPALGIYVYRRLKGWSAHELRHQHKRMVPYAINILSYLTCLYIMMRLHLPLFMSAIIAVSLLIQCICVLINIYWKISMHSAGSGGIIGALLAYSAIFVFNPLWWLCGAILVSGLVMTSRLVLRQHTLWQVLGGTLVGGICGYIGIIMI